MPNPGHLRPNVVWFGEIPQHLDDIETTLAKATLFVAIGTSGSVYPAAALVDTARRAGITTLEINLNASDRTTAFDHVIQGKASDAVPRWVETMLDGTPLPPLTRHPQ